MTIDGPLYGFDTWDRYGQRTVARRSVQEKDVAVWSILRRVRCGITGRGMTFGVDGVP